MLIIYAQYTAHQFIVIPQVQSLYPIVSPNMPQHSEFNVSNEYPVVFLRKIILDYLCWKQNFQVTRILLQNMPRGSIRSEIFHYPPHPPVGLTVALTSTLLQPGIFWLVHTTYLAVLYRPV